MTDSSIPFLKQLSEYFKKAYREDLFKVALVFPNRRAGLYFRRYLAEGNTYPVWSPEIFSIEDLVISIGKKNIGGNHQLLLSLYKAYLNLEGEKARDFEDFLNWAPVLLDDFNEIDLYLADPSKVFTYLSEAKALSQWSPETNTLSEFQLTYLHFFQSLGKLYHEYNSVLKENHIASQGSAYRYVSEHLNDLLDGLRWKKIVFAGFNALTLSEEKIIIQLLQAGKAEVFWDCDEYYLFNPVQEAGRFLRDYQNRNEFIPFRWISNHYKTAAKKIHIVGIPQHIGQAKFAGQLIESILPEERSETALVLGDENMLVPVLNSIPGSVSDFNVTMGLPLKLTPLNGLFEALFQLHLGSYSRNKPPDSPARSFYCKDLMSVFRHPWFSDLLDANHINAGYEKGEKGSGLKDREEMILSRSFFSHAEVVRLIVKPGLLDPYPLGFLFDDYSLKSLEFIKAFQKLIEYFKGHFKAVKSLVEEDKTGNHLEMEYLYSFSLLFSQILKLWEGVNIPLSLISLVKLIRQSVQNTRLSFYGEPLKGLQVMGMLETRNLDFRNIIMLHVNDDILPAGKSYTSFIPMDIKIHFQLPTYKERQAVFAYHFYRLLQQSEQVYLLYNTEPGQLAGGEKSRFIHQLVRELPLYNPKVIITEEILSFTPQGGNLIKPILVQKDAEIINKLRTINERGWSASTLNQYRACKLKFYFAQVAGIEEPEEPDESIDAAGLGSAFHETLEKLFRPYVGKALQKEIYSGMLDELPKLIPGIFKKHLINGDLNYGKNYLWLTVCESLIARYLHREKEKSGNVYPQGSVYHLYSVEQWMTTDLNGYKLSGKTDRIDHIGNNFRILDYKSGKITDDDLKLFDFAKLDKGADTEKAFQLLFYAFLFSSQLKYPPLGIEAGIVSLQRPDKGFLTLVLPKGTDILNEGMKTIKEVLLHLLDEIFDPSVPFSQVEGDKACKYCPYKPICLR
jgi:ATP-dependent helicase/nuclease subunit B